MNIESYIAQLLYRYQCVTVPGFGAFLTEIQSAQLIESSHSFFPPKKVISFNAHLKNNDGLLANHIAQAEKTSYEYEKVIPTSENEFIPNEYIQPSDPENANATFDNQGKINGQLEPTTRWETEPANAQTVNNS